MLVVVSLSLLTLSTTPGQSVTPFSLTTPYYWIETAYQTITLTATSTPFTTILIDAQAGTSYTVQLAASSSNNFNVSTVSTDFNCPVGPGFVFDVQQGKDYYRTTDGI